eukprot:TRINITY_DN77413_c0_g1_i1.p1 TRINITY_DN77413_c0_g1~~TRINITY_DN77413_c0_g1_i1.p1  ORF type:complete len:399 (+),score=39.71 TRINITY_DN77413_c0_g1_i1:47-1243(+)
MSAPSTTTLQNAVQTLHTYLDQGQPNMTELSERADFRILQAAAYTQLITEEGELAGQCTLAWLKIVTLADFTLNSLVNLLMLCGATTENFGCSGPTASEEHARTLLKAVHRVLRVYNAPEESLPFDISKLCPPLMAMLGDWLHILAEVRPTFIHLVPRASGIMLREFITMTVKEPLLFLFYDLQQKKVTAGHRVVVTGLTCNAHMRQLMPTIFSKAKKIGSCIQLFCWTILWRNEGAECADPFAVDMIWGEGILDDIPQFNGERVVVWSSGTVSRSISGCHTFPRIPVSWHSVDELSADELASQLGALKAATKEEYIEAVKYQMGTGGNTAGLKKLVRQQDGEISDDSDSEDHAMEVVKVKKKPQLSQKRLRRVKIVRRAVRRKTVKSTGKKAAKKAK